MSVSFPHKTIPAATVPLRRLSCSFEPETPVSHKLTGLMDLLWKKPESNEKIEKLFDLHRLLSYSSSTGERRYTAPFLHQFYTPTVEGMDWLKTRFLKKCHLDITFVHDASNFESLQDAFVKQASPCYIPFIIFDKSNFLLHATPCFFLKNSHGMFLYQLDSVGGEALNLPHKIIQTIVNRDITWCINNESRQKDGFSCRVEGFLILKQFHKAFLLNPDLALSDIFDSYEDSATYRAKEGNLKGSFLKTSQAVIEDRRANSYLIGREFTLHDFQSKFSASYGRNIESIAATISDTQKSSIYLQCKMLKFVFEYQKELEEKENRYKQIIFKTDEEF